MSIWLFRAGKNGEFESKFLNDKRIYLTWEGLKIDLSKYPDKTKLFNKLKEIYSGEKTNSIRNWAAQIYPIASRIEKGDWIVLPSKLSSTIHIGKVIGDYTYDEKADSPYFHYRDIDWFATDIPRNNFDQDILYSFGAFMTVCKITRNNAENRIKQMAENGWKVKNTVTKVFADAEDTENTIPSDIEQTANDTISKYIIQKFKGYRMEDLIGEILRAKGFTVYHSKQGADGGKDLLAAGGEMGFGSPKIAIQVKSHDAPVDRPTVDQLAGVMANVGAEYGLFVSWSGFKNSVEQERGNKFFKIRLWDSNDVIREIFNNYEKLSPEIRTEIPLKRVWMLNINEDDE